jgi:hypothetical protein
LDADHPHRWPTFPLSTPPYTLYPEALSGPATNYVTMMRTNIKRLKAGMLLN